MGAWSSTSRIKFAPGVTLTVNGQRYGRWASVRVTRGLKQGASSFQFETPAELVPAIVPFAPCVIRDGADTLLTGYVGRVHLTIGAKQSQSVIAGRSKTMDLVDCMPAFATNQFNGAPFDAIARAIAKPLGISVVIGPGVVIGEAFPDATFRLSEKAFAYLERLARQRGLLLTDDANGNLVITTVGTARAPADLLMGEGGNVFEAAGELNGDVRYSEYTIRSQAGMQFTGSDVQTGIEAVARDAGVPRYRPWAGKAESAALPGAAQQRANWEAAHRSGEAVKANLTVPEWRVGDVTTGPLWQTNQLAKCTVKKLGLAEQEMLIGQTEYRYDRGGKRVLLEVSPPSAFSPKPGKTKGNGNAWQGLIAVTGPNASHGT